LWFILIAAALAQGQLKARTIAESIDAELGPVMYVEVRRWKSVTPCFNGFPVIF
jgi:hypothetical protein